MKFTYSNAAPPRKVYIPNYQCVTNPKSIGLNHLATCLPKPISAKAGSAKLLEVTTSESE
jgi:hypothetical protein